MNDLKNAAKEYFEKGFSIVPMRIFFEKNEWKKTPLVEWKKWQENKQTLEEFESLNWNNANGFAIILGKETEKGFLAVVDFDIKKVDQEAISKGYEVIENLPITKIEETISKGLHLFYYSKNKPKNIKAYHDKAAIELIAENHLVIVSPSYGYKNLNDNPIMEVEDIEDLFMHALKKAGVTTELKEKAWFDIPGIEREAYRGKDPPCILNLLRGAKEGLRNEFGIRLASYFINFKQYDHEKVRKKILKNWNKLNNPPLPEKELDNIIKSAIEHGYVYGCSDDILSKNCNKENCPLQSKGRGKEEDVIELEHLNLIQDPKYTNKKIRVEGIVSSTSIPYLVPNKIRFSYFDENDELVTDVKGIEKDEDINLKLIGIPDDLKFKRLARFLKEKNLINFEELGYNTIYKIRVRPPVFTLEKKEEKIIDERGFEYKAYDIYVISDQALTFNPSTLIRIEGKVLPHPRTQLATLLVYKVEFPEETQKFDIEKIKILKNKFENLTIGERIDWLLENFELYSKIIKRKNLAFASLLCFFTPLYIKFNNEIIKGWGNILIIGDTTTAKSETLKKLIKLLKNGMLITAETASLVGLTGTATQIEKEGWFVDWGFLVLNDRKLLAIDGVQKLPSQEWVALAESERSGVITIVKAAKNSAYARTRQIKIANPIDKEGGKFSTSTLSSFLYPAQALASIFDKVSIARLDLAVFSSSYEVSPEEVNQPINKDYDKDLEVLIEVLKFCWNGKYEVEFEEEAINKILEEATNLYHDFYCDSIPICSIDLKYKLARLAASLAILTLSINEDFQKVIVKKEHVEYLVNFIKEEYSKAGLGALAKEERYEMPSEEDVKALIEKIMIETEIKNEEKILEIIKYIVLKQRITKEELKTQFSLADKNELRPLLAILSNEGLIKIGKGYYITPKLINYYKIIRGSYFEVGNRGNRGKNTNEQNTKLINLPRLPCLPSSEKNPPKISDVPKNLNEKSGGSYSEDTNRPNRTEMNRKDKNPYDSLDSNPQKRTPQKNLEKSSNIIYTSEKVRSLQIRSEKDSDSKIEPKSLISQTMRNDLSFLKPEIEKNEVLTKNENNIYCEKCGSSFSSIKDFSEHMTNCLNLKPAKVRKKIALEDTPNFLKKALEELQPNPSFKFSIEERKEKPKTEEPKEDQDDITEDYLIFSNKIRKEKFGNILFYVCNFCNFKTLTFVDMKAHYKTHEKEGKKI
jgi:hypothetical protein